VGRFSKRSSSSLEGGCKAASRVAKREGYARSSLDSDGALEDGCKKCTQVRDHSDDGSNLSKNRHNSSIRRDSDRDDGGASRPAAAGDVAAVSKKLCGKLRCTYAGCDRPDQSTRFHRVEAGQTAGGRNWDLLAGSVLCHACYCQYLKRGTLERTKNKPIAASKRRCTLIGCTRPDYGSSFYQIEPNKTAGGWDWSRLTGNVLCSACYQRYLRSGTLKNMVRPASHSEILAMEGRSSSPSASSSSSSSSSSRVIGRGGGGSLSRAPSSSSSGTIASGHTTPEAESPDHAKTFSPLKRMALVPPLHSGATVRNPKKARVSAASCKSTAPANDNDMFDALAILCAVATAHVDS